MSISLLFLLILLVYLCFIINVSLSSRTPIKINRETSSNSHSSNSNSYSNSYNSNSYSSRSESYSSYSSSHTATTIPASPHIRSTTNIIPLVTIAPSEYSDPPVSRYHPTAEEVEAAVITTVSVGEENPIIQTLDWRFLSSQCYSYKISNNYLYTVCPYHNVTQTNLRTGNTIIIGVYSHYKQSIHSNGLAHSYNGGSDCLATQLDSTTTTVPRKMRLLFECSYKNEIHARIPILTDTHAAATSGVLTTSSAVIPSTNNHNIAILTSVTEIKPCLYVGKLHTPLACAYSSHRPVPKHQPIPLIENESEMGTVVESLQTLHDTAAGKEPSVTKQMSDCIQALHSLNTVITSPASTTNTFDPTHLTQACGEFYTT